jgi:hypothetical protein
LSDSRQNEQVALTISAASDGYRKVLNTMADVGPSGVDTADLVMAKDCLVDEAIDLEIAERSDDKLPWQAQQRLTYIKLLVHDLCQVRACPDIASLVQEMCRGVVRHLKLTLRVARKMKGDGVTCEGTRECDIEGRAECSELHMSIYM